MAKKSTKGMPSFRVEDREPLKVDRREVDVTDFIVNDLRTIPIPEGYYIFTVLPTLARTQED